MHTNDFKINAYLFMITLYATNFESRKTL